MENFQPGLLVYRNHDTGIPLTGWICCKVITKQFFLLRLIDVLDVDKSSHPASRIRHQRLRLSERLNTTLDFYGKQLASCRFPFPVALIIIACCIWVPKLTGYSTLHAVQRRWIFTTTVLIIEGNRRLSVLWNCVDLTPIEFIHTILTVSFDD